MGHGFIRIGTNKINQFKSAFFRMIRVLLHYNGPES